MTKKKTLTIIFFLLYFLNACLLCWIKIRKKLYCTRCYSHNYCPRGFYPRVWRKTSSRIEYCWKVRRYRCRLCNKSFSSYSNTIWANSKLPPSLHFLPIRFVFSLLSKRFFSYKTTQDANVLQSSVIAISAPPAHLQKEDEHQNNYQKSYLFFLRECLNEKQRRLFLALDVLRIGRGAMTKLHKLTGTAFKTIRRGLTELQLQQVTSLFTEAIRKPGGGRTAHVNNSEYIRVLQELLEDETSGDPMKALKWSKRSLRKLSMALSKFGIWVSPNTIRKTLLQQGYSLKSNRARKAINADHPQREQQFNFISQKKKKFLNSGLPVISVDAKKKEMIANFTNPGQTWRQKPFETLDHQFPDMASGILVPYGVYELNRNKGWFCVGTNHSTAEFAVETIAQWWEREGSTYYANINEILILCDGGNPNANNSYLWKWQIQEQLVDKYGLEVHISHYPPGCSKWNPIEHRLFSFVSLNWAGRPLINYETALNYIKTTQTDNDLQVKAILLDKEYRIGLKISTLQYATFNIHQEEVCPQWNYSIHPRDKEAKTLFKKLLVNSNSKIKRKPAVKTLKEGKEAEYWLKMCLTKFSTGSLQHDVAKLILNHQPSDFNYPSDKKWSIRSLSKVCQEILKTKSASRSQIHRLLQEIAWTA